MTQPGFSWHSPLLPRPKSGSVLAAQAYIQLKLLTGIRRGDMLRLTMSDLRDDWISIEPGLTEGTTGKRMIIEWSDELRAAVVMAKAARPVELSPFLFCTLQGKCYCNEKVALADENPC